MSSLSLNRIKKVYFIVTIRPKGVALKPTSLSGHDFRKRKLPSATALSCAVNKRLDLNFD